MKLHGYWVLVSALALAACASSKPAQRSDENVAHIETRTTVTRTTDARDPATRDTDARDPATRETNTRDTNTRDRDTNARVASDAPRRPSDTHTAAHDKDAPVATPPVVAAEPDNTEVNKRDNADSALTPMDQGEGERDLKITQRIRQAVVGDDSLSFNAKNVKIITRDGQVTLRGPVASAKERTVIGAAAKNVAGAGRVDNQLEIEK